MELGVEEDGIDGRIDDGGDFGEGEAEKVVEMTFEGILPGLIKVDGFVHGAPGPDRTWARTDTTWDAQGYGKSAIRGMAIISVPLPTR